MRGFVNVSDGVFWTCHRCPDYSYSGFDTVAVHRKHPMMPIQTIRASASFVPPSIHTLDDSIRIWQYGQPSDMQGRRPGAAVTRGPWTIRQQGVCGHCGLQSELPWQSLSGTHLLPNWQVLPYRHSVVPSVPPLEMVPAIITASSSNGLTNTTLTTGGFKCDLAFPLSG